MYIYTYIHLHIHIHVCMHMHMYLWWFAAIPRYVCACIFMYLYDYMRYLFIYTHTHLSIHLSLSLSIHTHVFTISSLKHTIRWLQWVRSLKSYVSFAEYRLFHTTLLQNRPIILRKPTNRSHPITTKYRICGKQYYYTQLKKKKYIASVYTVIWSNGSMKHSDSRRSIQPEKKGGGEKLWVWQLLKGLPQKLYLLFNKDFSENWIPYVK